MLMQGKFVFLGVEAREGFVDKSKMNYLVGLSQGLDTIRLYIEAGQYSEIQNMLIRGEIAPYSEVMAELDYNPAAQKVQYCMRLVRIKSLKEGK